MDSTKANCIGSSSEKKRMTTTTTSSSPATVTTIAAMCSQERSGYKVPENLYQSDPPPSSSEQSSSAAASTTSTTCRGPLNAECRNKMAAWCYNVADYCKFNRETVSISLSYLDRFLATPAAAGAGGAMADLAAFQLSAMTCLYIAAKIHEPRAIDPNTLSKLSRGIYSAKQIEEMETTIIFALEWRLNPPTSLSFVRQLLELIPESVLCAETRKAVFDIAKYQTELAVECIFVPIKASMVALCSLLNSLESMTLDEEVFGYVSYLLSQALGLECSSSEGGGGGGGDGGGDGDDDDSRTICTVRGNLYQAVTEQPGVGTMVMLSRKKPSSCQKEQPEEEANNNSTSPSCVRSLSQIHHHHHGCHSPAVVVGAAAQPQPQDVVRSI